MAATSSLCMKLLSQAAFQRILFHLSYRTSGSAVRNAWCCSWCTSRFRTKGIQTRSFYQPTSSDEPTSSSEPTFSSEPFIDKETLNKLMPELHDPRDRPPKTADLNTSLQELPIVHIHTTHNNTIFTVTDHKGKVLAWTSGGTEGFRNTRKGTTFAAQTAGIAAAKKALKLGLNKRFRVKIKGIGPARLSSIKGLDAGGLNIVSIQDVTPVPHNGCKPRKARRL